MGRRWLGNENGSATACGSLRPEQDPTTGLDSSSKNWQMQCQCIRTALVVIDWNQIMHDYEAIGE